MFSRRIWCESIAFAGLALILVPIFTYTHETPFPGLAALPPCLGTVLIIWVNGRVDSTLPTIVGKVLSTRPFVFVGLISYSLYLWHWPVLAFNKYLSIQFPSPASRISMIGLGSLFALLSWKFVELPFRDRKIGATRKSVFALATAGLTIVCGFGLLLILMQGLPQRFSVQAQEFAKGKTDIDFVNELTIDDIRAGKLISLGVTDTLMRPTVFVWGDSHAMTALPAIDVFLKEKRLSGKAATHSATIPVLNWYKPLRTVEYGLGPNTRIYNDAVFSYIQSQKISDVILIARWKTYYQNKQDEEEINRALLETIQRLIAAGSQPWVFLEVPEHNINVPKTLALYYNSPIEFEPVLAKPVTDREIGSGNSEIINKIELAGGRILDPKPEFLDPTGLRYIIQSDGMSLYRDSHHLTTWGSKKILLPFLRRALTLSN